MRHPKELGLQYIPAEKRWVGFTKADVVPADAEQYPDAHGRSQQKWDIGTVANWWRVRRDLKTGVTQATRVNFP